MISFDGRPRAFWRGFFLTVLVVGVIAKPIIGFRWVQTLLNAYGQYQNLPNGYLNYELVFYDATLQALAMLVLATLTVCIGILIYDHN